jgi:hypothetical protein
MLRASQFASPFMIVCFATAAQADSPGPTTFAGQIQTITSNIDNPPEYSNVGPLLNLNQTVSERVTGSLDGEPWAGPLTQSTASTNVFYVKSGNKLGYVSAYSLVSSPTMPDPNIPDAVFSYQAGANSQASGSLLFWFEIHGPEPTSRWTINAYSLLSGSPTTGYSFQDLSSVLTVQGSEGYVINDRIHISYGVPNPPLITHTGNTFVGGSINTGYYGNILEDATYTLNTNEPYEVDIAVAVNDGITTETSGSDSTTVEVIPGGALLDRGYVDPTFSLAAGTPDADQWSISFSPGFTNGVPEPSTWAMMVLGFVGLGFVGYRATLRGHGAAVRA